VTVRFFVDGYHLNPAGIPVLVDAIHKATLDRTKSSGTGLSDFSTPLPGGSDAER